MEVSDYIEREALLRYLNDIWLSLTPTNSMPDDDRYLAMVHCMGLNDAMDAVRTIPAADVRPVVRGKWERMCDNDVFGDIHCKCSACGEDWWQGPGWFRNAKYCPNCGARMEES